MLKRIPGLVSKIPRLRFLRKIGVNTNQMARAMGTPAITYSVENTGMSDSHLQKARSAMAQASSPEGYGKNIDLIHYTVDTNSGTADPAFDANMLPLKYWSLAWWEDWRPHSTMEASLWAAVARIGTVTSWNKVVGPATTVVACINRLGWKVHSARQFKTDSGRILDLAEDPPVVIANEAKLSVRRWRWNRIRNEFPQLKV